MHSLRLRRRLAWRRLRGQLCKSAKESAAEVDLRQTFGGQHLYARAAGADVIRDCLLGSCSILCPYQLKYRGVLPKGGFDPMGAGEVDAANDADALVDVAQMPQ